MIEIYERVYDNPLNDDGTKKENKLLGEFELIEGKMDDYSYEGIVKSKVDNELYILRGLEVSGYYHPQTGGTRHTLEKLSNNKFAKALSDKIKSDLLAIAKKGELEELRREVENYFKS
mgnify:CR=1 FL=1